MKPTQEYIKICSLLDNKFEELMNFTLETFIFCPEIANLTAEIKELRKRKEELEEMLDEE